MTEHTKEAAGASGMPRADAVTKRIHSWVDPDIALDAQHDIKLLWHPENLRRVLKGVPFAARPVTAEIDPTLDCSYACPFCTYSHWESKSSHLEGMRLMRAEEMRTVIRRLHDGGVRGVIFTGGGEPFQNPHTPDGIDFASEVGLAVGAFSNGYALSEAVISRILAGSLDFLRISANAVTPSTYAAFHGLRGDEFAIRAWANIERASATIGTARTNFGLGVVVNSVNCRDLVPLIERARRIVDNGGRIDYIAFRPVVSYAREKQIGQHVLDAVEHAQEIGAKVVEGSELKLFFAKEYFATVGAANGRGPVETESHCVGHPWMVSVAYDGNVYLCSEGKYSPPNRLGNLLDQTLDEIWTSTHRANVLCSGCKRPPVCKAARLTVRLEEVLREGPLTDAECDAVDRALSGLRKQGAPGGIEFL